MPARNFPPRVNAKAAEIRRLLKDPKLGIREIARKVGVTHPYVSHMALREGLRDKRVYVTRPNPWGLSGRQYEAFEALTKHGLLKTAADELGISVDTFEAHLAAGKRRLGERNRTMAILKFDRWLRAVE